MSLCTHAQSTVRVSSHIDLSVANSDRQPTASTYCCARPGCQATAAAWVKRVTGLDAVIVPLPRAQP